MYKNYKRLIGLILVLSLLIGCSPKSEPVTSQAEQPAGPKTIMKIATNTAIGSPRELGCQKIKEIVERDTNGRIEVQIYPSSQLGNTNEVVAGLQSNNIEMVVMTNNTFSTVQPLVTILDIPFFYPSNPEDAKDFLASDAVQTMRDTTEEHNMLMLDSWYGGLKHFTCNKPLRTINDFKGVKFRSMPSALLVEQFKVLGAAGIYIGLPEVYNALATGAIDGQENPIDIIYEQKYHEVQKYLAETGHGFVTIGVVVGKEWFDKQLPEDQEVIRKAVVEGRKVCHEQLQKNETDFRQELIDFGIEFIPFTKEEKEKYFNSVKEAVIKVFLEKNPDGKELFEKFTEELKKYN